MHMLDLSDSSILVTGGTGSFGQAFIRNVLKNHKPARVIVYSRDEWKQSEMQAREEFQHPAMRFFLGDVRDLTRLTLATRGVDYIIHAAALKQVPAAEYNPMEAIRTNVGGAENVVYASLQNEVKGVVALSTDKAANPVNLYGASKLASDKIFSAANNLSGSIGTKFSVVRYGNVVGSRGSVIPLFQRLIREGTDHLPVTDDRMTRFWITVEQGVSFVMSSLAMMRGGELFVPKIPSMKVIDVAKALAPDLPTKVIGIRPGEKLHEMLITEDESRMTYEMVDRYVVTSFDLCKLDYLNYLDIKPVPEGFSFSSDKNDWWLDPAGLNAMLDETTVMAHAA